jgi:hypothetical protein
MSSRTRRRVVEAPSRKKLPPELRSIRIGFEPDPFVDETTTAYLRQEGFEDRLAAYEKDEFDFVYARAEAEVVIEEIMQVLTSAGLYGIESDTDEEALSQIVSDEWIALRKVLTAVGVPTEQLPLEVDRTWVEWRM